MISIENVKECFVTLELYPLLGAALKQWICDQNSGKIDLLEIWIQLKECFGGLELSPDKVLTALKQWICEPKFEQNRFVKYMISVKNVKKCICQ